MRVSPPCHDLKTGSSCSSAIPASVTCVATRELRAASACRRAPQRAVARMRPRQVHAPQLVARREVRDAASVTRVIASDELSSVGSSRSTSSPRSVTAVRSDRDVPAAAAARDAACLRPSASSTPPRLSVRHAFDAADVREHVIRHLALRIEPRRIGCAARSRTIAFQSRELAIGSNVVAELTLDEADGLCGDLRRPVGATAVNARQRSPARESVLERDEVSRVVERDVDVVVRCSRAACRDRAGRTCACLATARRCQV